MLTARCVLCSSEAGRELYSRDHRRHYECASCGLVFLDRAELLSPTASRERYLLHENGPEHEGYREFLARAIRAARPFLKRGWRGLDFGCGPGPALSKFLSDEGFSTDDYDPLFRNTPLKPPYDFVFSTETFEHFHDPARDIARVISLLKTDGVLTVMTDLNDGSVDFSKWHYATDPTHTAFYSEKTLAYVASQFGLAPLAFDSKRVFVFRKERS